MLKWFVNEYRKEVEEPPSTMKFFIDTFITLIPPLTWSIYFLALFFIGIGFYTFHVEQRHRNALWDRNGEIRQADDKPPPKRRPGVPTRRHEIFRNVLGKAQQYEQPTDVKYILQYAKNGTIYGTPAAKEKWVNNNVVTMKEDKSLKAPCNEIFNEYNPET